MLLACSKWHSVQLLSGRERVSVRHVGGTAYRRRNGQVSVLRGGATVLQPVIYRRRRLWHGGVSIACLWLSQTQWDEEKWTCCACGLLISVGRVRGKVERRRDTRPTFITEGSRIWATTLRNLEYILSCACTLATPGETGHSSPRWRHGPLVPRLTQWPGPCKGAGGLNYPLPWHREAG